MPKAYTIKNQEELYFVTFTVVGWADVFSRKIYRDIIIDSLDYCRKNKGLEIYGYVIMTNHIHIILKASNTDLSDIIRDFKKHTSKEIVKSINTNGVESRKDWLNMIFEYYAKLNKRKVAKQFWTNDNHAVVLDNNVDMDKRINYIHQNPVTAGWVEKPEDYLYSSARNYAALDNVLETDQLHL